MNAPKVGIIGGTNGMGRWLADLLAEAGCDVQVTGRKTEMTAAAAAAICKVVVVSVPIAATAEVIREVGPLLGPEQIFMDLTSLKKEPVELMLRHSRAEVVGCHPLFGPAVADPAGLNIVLCAGRGTAGFVWIKTLFEKAGYSVWERSPEEHDRLMAVIHGLNHLNTIALGLAVSASGIAPEDIARFATPVFKAKMELAGKVFGNNPGLYAEIIARNPDIEDMLKLYTQAVKNVGEALAEGGSDALRGLIESAAPALFTGRHGKGGA